MERPPLAQKRHPVLARPSAEGLACTNPASLSGDGEALRPYFATQSGLVPNYEKWEALPGRPIATRYQTVPDLVSARCAKTDGATYLAISIHADSDDPRADNVPGKDRRPASKGLHSAEVIGSPVCPGEKVEHNSSYRDAGQPDEGRLCQRLPI